MLLFVGDERDGDAKKAFEALLLLTLKELSGPVYETFADEVKYRAKRDYDYYYGEEPVSGVLLENLLSHTGAWHTWLIMSRFTILLVRFILLTGES